MRDTAKWLEAYLKLFVPAALLRQAIGAVAGTIAALEKERDAVLADNATFQRFVMASADRPKAGCMECGWFGHHGVGCELGAMALAEHPGATLLEEHRKALVRARNEGLQEAARTATELAMTLEENVLPEQAVGVRRAVVRILALTRPAPCCERDTDGDGNCDRHPGRLS